MTGTDSRDTLLRRSRRYSTIKYSLSIAETLYCIVLLAAFQWSGFSAALVRRLAQMIPGQLHALPLYVAIGSVAYYILEFPFTFYRSFLLEHQFKLTRQGIKDWFLDQLKGGMIMLLIGIAGLEIFLYAAKTRPADWWWITAGIWIFFSIAVTRLAPLVIIPLFFKYSRISDHDLRQRILALAARMKLAVLDVFEINLSVKTEKANAALVGLGKTRRVLLADTLISKYTPDEIEAIVAHEFAHQRSSHLVKSLAFNAAAT
ncbi:MAG: M48 family metalloprotease, partial [Candidatus Omnitrophica bacterium]|nr:M48 family metalloprotease [Candidatus Omnitrophota bacterium]